MNDKDFIIDEYNTLVKYKGNDSIVKIPDGITTIGHEAFEDCKSLTSITIPNSVTSIGDDAFSDCTSLKSVTIPKSVTSIGDGTFYGCKSLTSLIIPNSVTSIGWGAFEGCTSLASVTIPNSVTSIGKSAFDNCYSLKSVTIPESVTTIGDYAFDCCINLNSITIPSGVTSIGSCTFRNSGLKSITIPNNVKCIGESAFISCSLLESVTIQKGVTTIGNYAFDGCTRLESVTIPNSVTHIGENVFGRNCDSLTIRCNKGSYAEQYAQKHSIPYSYIEQDKEKENKQQPVINKTERTPTKPIKNGDIVQLTNFDNLYGMVSGMNEDHIFVLDCNGDERHIERSKESALKPIKSSPAIKKAFCEMLDQIEMRQQIRNDIYNLEEQESEYDSKIADNTTLLRSLLSEKGKNNRDIER